MRDTIVMLRYVESLRSSRIRRRQRGTFSPTVDRLEDRRLLTSTVFAKSFGAGPNNTVSVEAEAVDSSGNIFITGNFGGTVTFGSTTLTSTAIRNIFVVELNPAGTPVWAMAQGSASPQVSDFGKGIAVDSAGNVYVTGSYGATGQFGSTTLTNAGGSDIFIEKMSSSGTVVWAKGYGGPGFDTGQGIAVDGSGNIYTAGAYQNSVAFGSTTLTAADNTSMDVFVTKLNSAGTVVWAKSLAGSGQNNAFGIALDGLGNVDVVGNYTGTGGFGNQILTSQGDSDIFVSQLTSAGAVNWAVSQGGSGHDDATSVAADSSGNIFVTGDYIGSATFGSVPLSSAGQDDGFIERLNSSGNVVWADSIGGTGFDAGFGISLDSSDNVYTTGVFQGTATFASSSITSVGGYDIYVTISNSSGTTNQAFDYGSASDDQAFKLAAGPSSSLTVVGDYGSKFNVQNDGAPATASGFVFQLSTAAPAAGSEALSNFNSVGYSQLSVYRPSTQNWYTLGQTGGQALGPFGGPNDIAAAGDYDSLGHTQLAVYRPSTGQWFAKGPSVGHVVATFGGIGDVPVPGDYDGVGHTEPAVYRPSTGEWFAYNNGVGHLVGTFGGTGDIPAPGDYFGTGKTELAVYRPSTSQWFVLGPSGGHLYVTFGGPGDVPAPGDYDGVGHAEPGIFRPSTAQWFVYGSLGGHLMNTFGGTSFLDVPTEAAELSLIQLGYFGGGGGGSGMHAFSVFGGMGPVISFGSSGVATTSLAGLGSTPVVRTSSTPQAPPTPIAIGGIVPSVLLSHIETLSVAIDELYG